MQMLILLLMRKILGLGTFFVTYTVSGVTEIFLWMLPCLCFLFWLAQ